MSNYMVCEIPIEEVQSKMLDILKAVDELCKKHNIRYVLDSGTLLGAVRHNGFIPWDDDIDIAMLREDYDCFCKVASELPEPYIFEDMFTKGREKSLPNIFGKCYDTTTYYLEKSAAHLSCRHSVYLDIFPIDNVDPKSKKFQCRLVATLNAVRCIKLKTEPFAARHIFYLPLLFLPIKTLNKIADRLMRWHNSKTLDDVCPICQSGTAKPIFKRSMFLDTINHQYCDLAFPIPNDYMAYLRGYYRDPMQLPPEGKRNPTHGIVEIRL